MNNVVFSHKSDDWYTPSDLYSFFCDHGFYDPCPLHADFDGLCMDWSIYDRIFINPPFSKIRFFVDKAIKTCILRPSARIVLLLPVRTDTQYFRLLFNSGFISHYYFVTGRLKFGGSSTPAPFPVCFIVLTGKRGFVPSIQFVDRAELIDCFKLLLFWWRFCRG